MTLQEYKQKKRECFVKFCKDNGIDQEVNFDAFDQIFDRAYSLGKQEKEFHSKYAAKRVRGEWFDLTQSDIEQICEDYQFNEI